MLFDSDAFIDVHPPQGSQYSTWRNAIALRSVVERLANSIPFPLGTFEVASHRIVVASSMVTSSFTSFTMVMLVPNDHTVAAISLGSTPLAFVAKDTYLVVVVDWVTF